MGSAAGATGSDRVLIWAIVASHFGPPFMFSGVAVVLPALGEELGAGATALGLVETLFLAGSMAFLLPAGRLADATDKGALFKFGLATFAALSIGLAFSTSLPMVLVLRFLQGVTSALFAATGTALLADLVPRHQQGRVFGAAMGVVYAGLTLGPMVAGWLIGWWSWRGVFVLGAALILGSAILVAPRLPSRWRGPGDAVHLPSVALVVTATLGAVAGSALLRDLRFGVPTLVVSAALAAAFAMVQLRTDRPLLDLRALGRNAVLREALLVQLVIYLNAYCSLFMQSLYVQVSLGLSAGTAGGVLAIGSVVMAVTAPLAGRLADALRPAVVTAAGCTAVFASALFARTLHLDSGPVAAALVLAMQGLGFGLFSSPNMAAIMSAMPPAESGMASALAAKARSIGMVTGMLVTAGLISMQFGDEPVANHPQRFVDTMTTVYSVLAGTAAVAALVAMRSVRRLV